MSPCARTSARETDFTMPPRTSLHTAAVGSGFGRRGIISCGLGSGIRAVSSSQGTNRVESRVSTEGGACVTALSRRGGETTVLLEEAGLSEVEVDACLDVIVNICRLP